ncbi:tetratricopeptide repeat protein [Sphingomonas endolithica]|uniref:SPOR domain-containing protein n=1 Tax=Sphingomonas endolithica TaxID=2972485 RepID=UPI0021B029FB|nr:tetratricopeptide repeat protein [Sphingomonas sp. ZFBP2030]
MKTRALFTMGLSGLVLAGAVAGVSSGGFTAIAGVRDADKMGAKSFDAARKNLAKGKFDAAIKAGEQAVGYAPQVAEYRVLLGQAYLKAGRFTSAHSAFADAVTLDPSNGKAALHLALAEIAEGQWDGARRTLDAHAGTIPVSDRGLAMALAGDPAAAVELLSDAARAPEADAKTRQNYALALALAGRWADARTVVAMDVAPDQVDARITQWASFAKPTSASDQVASLLGVTPVQDPGQPIALALSATGGGTALAAQAPVESYMPGAQVQPEAVAAVAADVPAPVPAEPQMVAASVSNVSFGARQEVVQARPVTPVRAVGTKREIASGAATPTKNKAVAVTKVAKTAGAEGAGSRALAKGNFFVQLGAYDNAAVARDAWGRVSRAHAGFAGQRPLGVPVSTKAGTFYRLSVGGFARGDAVQLCQNYKAKGGNCFVRAGAGDKTAAWVKPSAQLASR